MKIYRSHVMVYAGVQVFQALQCHSSAESSVALILPISGGCISFFTALGEFQSAT